MNNILEKIVAAKQKRIDEAKSSVSVRVLEKQCKDVRGNNTMRNALQGKKQVKIIAEYKKASPSAGIISTADPVSVTKVYEESGVAAVSVLTERDFFNGSLEDLMEVKKNISVPILRKDFIIDEYQVFESAVSGADALLLIAAILKKDRISHLMRLADAMGIDAVVEVHTRKELDTILETEPHIIGINNRNLDTFSTDVSVTEDLMKNIPDTCIVISESGITSLEAVALVKKCGVNAVLIGEYFMRAGNIKACVEEMVQAGKN